MNKKSKLSEKATRIPEIREQNWDKVVPGYLPSVRSQASESAKSSRFLLLLNDLFGIQPGFIEDYVSGIEKFIKVKQKDHILKGEVDNLFGNLIIEFERDLGKKQDEAKKQLQKYVACLWSQESSFPLTPYLCLATDGINFAVYSPSLAQLHGEEVKPEKVNLKLIEQIDWSQFKPQDIYFWLDRYFFRQEIFAPKSENIVKDFGANSHAFQVASQALFSLWRGVKEKPDFQVVYELWEKYLRLVYGTEVAEEELFCKHTYLATLAKLMVWCRLSESRLDNSQIISVLGGQFFKDQGIENFLEEDFFSWIVRENAKDTGLEVARMLLSLLKNYNLRELSEDVLKSLYQELVDPKTRHDLGEFYTPDWLAHRMINKLIEENPKASFLDPSCGSGTFIYLAIREKKDRLPKTRETLEHILNSIYGIDIHPLAVIVSKTNYILALGDLLQKRRKINIPIYLSDTIKLPERRRAKEVKIPQWFDEDPYEVEIKGKPVYFSKTLIQQPEYYDEAIEAAKEFARQNIGKKIEKENFLNFIQIQHPKLPQDQDTIKGLYSATKTLKEFIEDKRDSIWAFFLKNYYKPLFLKGKFDFVVGNPPWLSFRYTEPGYQKFLKEQITGKYCLLSGRGELITHLELGTLFLIRTADLYLKDGGTIAFVLPRSVFTADQHDGLRRGTFKSVNLAFKEAWDLEEVYPLFNVPSCVLIAEKQQKTKISYPISGLKITGRLDRKNASLDEAEKSLSMQNVEFYLHKRGKRSYWDTEKSKSEEQESFYKKHFFQGATIVPRSFWFVEVKASSLGFDPSLPLLESSERAKKEAKEAYKGLIMKGNVESQFLYATLLSTDLLPFGHLDYRLVVLPIEPAENQYQLLKADEARKRGFLYLTQWLEKAQGEWERRRGAKAKAMSIYERLDRYRGLTKQNPQAKYRILYNTSGTFLCACVAENRPIEFDIEGQALLTKGFIADTKTYCMETSNYQEVQCLCAILNAPSIDKLLKPMQSRGQWGPRDIHKKVFEIPIPKFNELNPDHLHLAALGKECHSKVSQWVESGGPGKIQSIGVLRKKVREMLSEELSEIDALVRKILGSL